MNRIIFLGFLGLLLALACLGVGGFILSKVGGISPVYLSAEEAVGKETRKYHPMGRKVDVARENRIYRGIRWTAVGVAIIGIIGGTALYLRRENEMRPRFLLNAWMLS